MNCERARQTNADKVRAKTDEELAYVIMCPKDITGKGIEGCDHKSADNCYECALLWLKQEAEE